jgi:hypothetical protein
MGTALGQYPILGSCVCLCGCHRHAGALDERFAKQTQLTFRGPEPRGWPCSVRPLAMKAQVVAASIDVTRA